MILLCKFDSEPLNEKIKSFNIESANVNLIEKALDLYVDDVYNNVYNGETLTFEEWEKWISNIKAIEKILDFSGILKYN